MKKLDLITIGRSSVDLYGAQIGGKLEDVRGFRKYIGGSPTNTACGTAKLGLKSAVITAVGDEHMGRFVTEELARLGVDTTGVKVDPDRLTGLVLLGIRDKEQFPLIFYRENCADMGLTPEDIDPGFIRQARALVASGTHLSHPQVAASTIKALEIARDDGMQTALDIDYRPNLWGVAGHGDGESRFVESAEVTAKLQTTLHLFDLIVGTEEEFHIAGGSTDTVAALRAVRDKSDATLVCKLGAKGAVAFTGDIPDNVENGPVVPGFPIEVFNVLGPGDGFMAGLLKGWLDGEDWARAITYANACGALAVSRHGCTPAYPSLQELEFFLSRGVTRPDLRNDAELNQVHWATNRNGDWPDLRVFAFDHRMQLQELDGATPDKIGRFKELCLDAAHRVAAGQDGYGFLCDDRLGETALHRAAGGSLWIGRPVEWPGSRPLTLEPSLGPDFGGLATWPAGQVVKVLCFCHPDDPAEMQRAQEDTITRLFTACRRNDLEFLLEVIPSKVGDVADDTTARLIRRFYEIGIFPDWWKLEPMRSAKAWDLASAAIMENDPHCRGIVVLGLGKDEADLAASFEIAAKQPLVKGFAVGRTIFSKSAEAWMKGEMFDADAVAQMAANYQRLCDIWDKARG
ncbi:bifunctional 5-dehydro-2-deoxygluconokinase/5-dehydro-2-deoxyphosphogluconate aldolase [Sulfitobacter mediterraneus]|uniref:bifunctional 5-dehydro-2-deoxygluconokinase/5-dehydro-2- deoxyphosphogluconate aldolase n=1 Tax=Sulfitobacter mediterraneus TaxID=83219 RepID=UPI0021A67B7F|nr:5-dehydro-2-deoxygluconokinase [Sulfitobacter mediterraneus]UWR10661.1 5-dehydro-2-deoxygluconokinase [Sulfitobacter mediterraneus]